MQSSVTIGNIYHSPIIKPNMGAAIALQVVCTGYPIVIAARTTEKLERVRDSIIQLVPEAKVDVRVVDVLDPQSVSELSLSLPTDLEVDLVQSAGLSAGTYQIPNENPYLLVEDVPPGLPTAEFDVVVRGLLNMVQAFLERWRSQSDTRLVVVSSMSGIRSYPRGYAHSSAKAGLHHAVRSLTLELMKQHIYVSEVNPGAVDTGFYDPLPVREAVTDIGLQFGYDYTKSGIPQMPPSAVGDAVVLCLTSSAHILSINAVARGQFPHLGA